jgi:hypothetical protein
MPVGSQRVDQGASAGGGSMRRWSQGGQRGTAGRREWSFSVLDLVLIGLALVGVVLVGFGVKMLVDTRRFLATAEPAGGVVVRVDERVSHERVGSGDNEHWADVTRRYPFVEFRTARGQVAQFQADDGSLQVGDSVRVVYDPADPRVARLDKWGNRWAGPLAFWGAGLALLVVAGATFLLVRA